MPALALLTLLALTCARAEVRSHHDEVRPFYHHRSIDASGGMNLEQRGCPAAGRWYSEGALVSVRDSCLRCRCAGGALSCARAACAPAPEPPPSRCALLHRRGACCPELHCPDGVRSLELEAESRMEERSWDAATPASPAHACTEEGMVFAAGSALGARAACERCFCLRGERRCVRPACLPPPPGCAPRPAPGACCPERYYCEPQHATTAAPVLATNAPTHRTHDCKVKGKWMSEGSQVPATLAGADNCSLCFCLRGALRCQPAACARPLRGCTPLLREGHCCPHQYHCPHHTDEKSSLISDNALISAKYEERSLRSSSTSKSSAKPQPTTSTPPPSKAAKPATSKVKRKTNDAPPKSSSTTAAPSTVTTTVTSTTTVATTTKTTEAPTKSPTTTTSSTTTEVTITTTKQPLDQTSTEQPEGSVRVIVNSTINCTAELSSSLHNTTDDTHKINDTDTLKILSESEARVPSTEMQTAAPADIITRAPFAGDSFIVNVSSSLFTNKSSPIPAPPAAADHAADFAVTHNMSKKTKEDYDDYDYTEPTLPPSLPNLKIIPFVAADAVVDEDEPPKVPYPILEREDKFPVYYPAPVPAVEHKKIPFATRREDVYHPTQYPVFVSGKEADRLTNTPAAAAKPTKPIPIAAFAATSASTVTTPEVNLFSPPAETEGGFIPKGPGLIAEYYAVYPSTPPPVPHLTTSMQINPAPPDNLECVTSDGRRVPEGESVLENCAACACAWGELHCAPRRCPPAPPHCYRRPPAPTSDSTNICCGEIVCDDSRDNTPMSTPSLSTRTTEVTLNVSNVLTVPTPIESDVIPFDPPPDRTPPELLTSTFTPAVDRQNALETNVTSDNKSISNRYKPSKAEPNSTTAFEDSQRQTTMSPPTFTKKEITAVPISSTTRAPAVPPKEINDTISQEYEDEEEDEGFSFGSVLKLLLSDNYDSSTAATTKRKPVSVSTTPLPTSSIPTRAPPPTTRKPPGIPHGAIPPFVPIQQHAYIPPKKVPQSALDRIDHLVLGESTAIRKPTPRPLTTTFRPNSTTKRSTTRKPTTTRKPIFTTTKVTTQMTNTEQPNERFTPPSKVERYTPPPSMDYYTPSPNGERYTTPPSVERFTSQPSTEKYTPPAYVKPSTAPAPSVLSVGGAGGGGLLKLAGCNIYGRMYRVGRIIAELSSPCQECRCTEIGVQCAPLHC